MQIKRLAVLLIAVLLPALWEVQPRELAVILLCGLIVGACGLLWRVVAAKHNLDPIVLDLRSPSATDARNALKTTGIVSRFPSITLILRHGRSSQITAAIIQSIAVYMVHLFARQIKNESVHGDGRPVFVAMGVKPSMAAVAVRRPIVLRQPVKISGIYNGNLAASKWNQADRRIGWLDYRLPGFPGKHGLNFIAISLIVLGILTVPGALGQGQNFPGGGSSSSSSSTFTIGTAACGSSTSCLQWVDDDTTDNCGAATTAWLALVNAYNGPTGAYAQVIINGSGSGKAYKLATCNLAFTMQTGQAVPSVRVNLNATIDCQQSGAFANCIQFGLAGLTGYSTGGKTIEWTLDGGGSLVGCLNVTVACVESEPFQGHAVIDGLHFYNTGAGNATLGNCTNFTVSFDSPTAEPEISNTRGYWATTGVCVLSNIDSTTLGGQNTLRMNNNHWAGSPTTPPTGCGSIAHLDSSSHSAITNNSLYGFGMLQRLQNSTGSATTAGGWMIANNSLDSAGCAAKGVSAMIHFGGNASSTAIGPASIMNNETCCSTHTTNLLALAGDTTATQVKGLTLVGNLQLVPTGNLFPAATQCTATLATVPGCYVAGNQNYNPVVFSPSNNLGWSVPSQIFGGLDFFAQAANLSAQGMPSASTFTLTAAHVIASCGITINQAATTSSTMPSCTIGWTDANTSVVMSKTVTATSATNTVGTFDQGFVFLYAKQQTQITVSTSGYVSTGATPMQYAVAVRLVQN